MANKTDTTAGSVHGTDPQYLVEKILRTKIYESTFWKEHCFGLTAETLVDKAVEIQYIGGTFGGNRKPTPFMCLMLKMLQIQPDREIIIEFILNDDYKYVRLLGAFYLRLVGRPVEIYQYLEPLLNDYRKIRYKETSGKVVLTNVDVVIDTLLTKEYYLDIAMPRLTRRQTLEETSKLPPRESALDELNAKEIEGDEKAEKDPSSSSTHESKSSTAAASSTTAPPAAAAAPANDINEDEEDEGEIVSKGASSAATSSTSSSSNSKSSSSRRKDDNRSRSRSRSRDKHHRSSRRSSRSRSSDRRSSRRSSRYDSRSRSRSRGDRDSRSNRSHRRRSSRSSSSSRSRSRDRSDRRRRSRSR